MSKFQKSIDQYQIICELSTGFTATVFLATHQDTKYAIKKFSNQKSYFAFEQYSLTKELAHKNIIIYHDHRTKASYKRFQDQEPQICEVLIMELADNGELFDIISRFGRLKDIIARTYFHQIIQTLQYLHNDGLFHLDIKLQNLLLDKQFHLKLADFGFATHSYSQIQKFVGTEGYMAPQIYSRKGYDGAKADLFAAGVVLFTMVVGTPPFNDTCDQDPYFRNLTTDSNRFWRSYKGIDLSMDFKSLIQGILKKNPHERLSLDQIKKHGWYNGDILMGEDLTRMMKKLTEN